MTDSPKRHEHERHAHAHAAREQRRANWHSVAGLRGDCHDGAPLAAATADDAANVEYAYPMHPQVRQIGLGFCPICGMAFEPVVAPAIARQAPSSAT